MILLTTLIYPFDSGSFTIREARLSAKCPHSLALVKRVLNPLAARFGKDKIRITSGSRGPRHNKAVGGSPHSLHMCQDGIAVDLVVDKLNWQAYRYLRSLRAVHELIWYRDHIHVGILRGRE